VWAEWGRVWRITQVSHKPFPSGRATHGGIDGILQLRERYGIQADEVEKLTLRAPLLIHELVGRPLQPEMRVNYARLCMQYVGALALATGQVDVADFRPERLTDVRLHRLGQRIEVVIDEHLTPHALSPQTVSIRLRDGREVAVEVPHTLGSPERPLSRAQYVAKFRRCVSVAAKPLAVDAAERVIAMVERLEDLPNTNDLMQVLHPVAG
jgi:2-methylcitrate dehydratase PrpD